VTSGRERTAILTAVRAALGGDRASANEVVEARLRTPPRVALPERATRGGNARLAQFVEMVRFSQASIDVLDARSAIPAAVARIAAARALAPVLVLAGDNALRGLDWPGAGVRIEARLARPGDALALALADAGIAETGTLALRSGAHSPSTANFLPEHHLVALPSSRVFAGYEDYWDDVRRTPERDGVAMPRTVNWITGPSRSGDIELRMLMGAHGPLTVHVLLYADG
jgi:L-lactate dehydrogenase complex protein LldG